MDEKLRGGENRKTELKRRKWRKVWVLTDTSPQILDYQKRNSRRNGKRGEGSKGMRRRRRAGENDEK